MMGWYNTGGMGTGAWIAMIAIMVMFWGLVIVAGIVIFRGTSGGTSRGPNDSTPPTRTAYRDPVDILDERFARGELDSDEYESRKATLRGTNH